MSAPSLFASFVGALRFFTRLRIPGTLGQDGVALERAIGFFPATGLLVGGVAALAFVASALVVPKTLAVALATFFRVLAVALPSVVLFVTVDPTDLADGLAQIVHLPARFVLGALAGLRMVGLFLDDWRALDLARRARGVADRGRIRRFVGMAFALLVLSIRRGSKLATAMEARGFGAPVRRTWARTSTFGAREWLLVSAGAAISAISVAAAVWAGTWNFILGPR